MSHRSVFFRGGLALILLSFLIGTALAQIPDKFENLEVLPKDISKRELVSVMRGFAGALGQRCNFCHVPGADPNSLEGMDFASDEPEHKRAARAMMRMVNDINQNHINKLEDESPVQVQCFTCHHGVKKPEKIEDIMMGVIEMNGLGTASMEYKKLRKEYHGTASYDFSSGPLNTVAEELAGKEDFDGAVEVMKMNIEFNPGESYPHLLLGQIYAQKGDKEAAIASVQKALEIDPENGHAKRVLVGLQSGN